ncbi:MAG: hypothetical protein GY778_05690 [bacterium]|nr:hypothetical protein [bacterium]
MKRGIGVVCIIVVCLATLPAAAVDGTTSSPAYARLQAEAPQVRAYEFEGRITRLYGPPMSVGNGPEESVEMFRLQHARVLGVNPGDLEPIGYPGGADLVQPVMFQPATGDYKFTVVRYGQFSSGIPVFRADARMLVRNEANYPLVLVSSGLRPLPGFKIADDLLANLSRAEFVAKAFESAKQQALLTVPDLVNFTTPEVVVWAGLDGIQADPRVALTFVADNFGPGGASDQKRLFVADVQTGDILHHESAILDVDGNASGMVTQGVGADFCEPEALTPFPHLNITSGLNTAITDANGDFIITAGGGTVDATLADGVWFDVRDFIGTVESVSVPASTPANLVFNALNTSEFTRAQSNGYTGANVVRDFTASFNPLYPTFTDTNIPCWTNRTDGFCPGNAWYDPSDGGSPTGYSINFCRTGGGFPNTAWTSVIYHEFGHHLVNAAGSGQGQYGEGTGDVMSVIILDDPRLGMGFFGTCDLAGTLRNADNTFQYPCSGGSHTCGQLISGCVWSTRNQLVVTEPVNYTNILGNLEVNSILLHTGSTITPQITVDWLTLDDDDGNIGNGSPHYPEICAGFGAHNMDCPPLLTGMLVSPTSDFSASGDPGGPFFPDSTVYTVENLGPGAISYAVTVTEPWLTVSGGTGTLPNVNDTAPVTITVNTIANGLPIGRHNATIIFTNTTDGVGNTIRFVNLNIGIPDDCIAAVPVCTGSFNDSTAGMTNDGSASCGTSTNSPDMWYTYTPDTNGTATFSMCTGTAYDSVLSIHSGCPGTTGNQLACDDDGCGSSSGPSSITLSVTAGTEYVIRVSGFDGSMGSFTMTITGPDCVSPILDITFPNGVPEALVQGVPTNFDVQILPSGENYVPGTGLLHYRYSGGAYQTAALTPLGGDLFQATLPAANCNDTPEFYVSAQGDLGGTAYNPDDAPFEVFSAIVGSLSTAIDDDFNTDLGWTVENIELADGAWNRGVPVGGGDRLDPATCYGGTGVCYLTDNVDGNSDVDGGPTRLVSPLIDLGIGNVTLEYAYWFQRDDTDGDDRLDVDVSVDGGTNWTTVASHNNADNTWRTNSVLLNSFVTPSANARIRFATLDNPNNSVLECGVDSVTITSVACSGVESCSDGILNQDEDRIDCGGVCPACTCTTDGACDNGDFCDGAETCDAFGECAAGTAVDCDDGVACTDDSCNEGTDSCDNVANDGLCDNGDFCDGAETCDAVADCQAGTAVDCEDGVGCTDDACNEGTDSCDNVASDGLCDNGDFCDGAETCDAVADCQAGTAVDCDDGVGCTDDACNEGTDSCDNVASDGLCDNGDFCDGAETCDAVADCQAGTAVDCDDGVGCTDDSCNEGTDSCDNVASDGLCDNGDFCDGAETCDSVLDCQAGSDPCPGQSCDEVNDVCVAPATVVSGRTCMMHDVDRYCFDQDGGLPDPRLGPAQLELDLTGDVSSVSVSMSCASGHLGSPTVSIGSGLNGPASRLTVDFDPLPNIECCTVTLSGDAVDQYDISALAGDVNGSGAVNATDKNLVKGNIINAVDAEKYVFDVNASNTINATDKNLTKGWMGTSVMPCP